MRKFQPWVLEYLFCNLQNWRRIISLRGKNYKKSHINPSLMILFPPQLGIQKPRSFLLSSVSAAPLLVPIDPDSCEARCHWSHTLLLIGVGCPGPTWRPVSTPGGICVFLFCGAALAPQQGKGHTWKDPECLSDRGINSHPDCHIQRPHCLSPRLPKPQSGRFDQ